MYKEKVRFKKTPKRLRFDSLGLRLEDGETTEVSHELANHLFKHFADNFERIQIEAPSTTPVLAAKEKSLRQWIKLIHSPKTTTLKVDVMIPTYNRPKGLRRAIKSVLYQHSPNWELYVYNDGSDYDFKEIIQDFNDERTHWLGKTKVSNQERCEMGHVSKVRNRLAQASHNSLLLWLDDDDHLWPDAIGDSIHYFEQHPHVKIIFGKMTEQYREVPNETLPKARDIRWPGKSLQDPYLKLGTPQVVMRRKVLSYAEWPIKNLPEKGILEDAVFFRKLGQKYLFHRTDILMANVQWHSKDHGHAILTKKGKQLQKKRESWNA